MRLSINWLRDYVDIDVSPQELADALTMAGLEVETLEKRYAPLDRVVVGKVLSVERHPDADRLFLCAVTDGSKEYRIICGAPNTEVGMLAPLALDGAKLPSGMKVKQSKVRGVVSEGMLCAEDELGLCVLDLRVRDLNSVSLVAWPDVSVSQKQPVISPTVAVPLSQRPNCDTAVKPRSNNKSASMRP